MRRIAPGGVWVTALVMTVVLTAAACGRKKAPIARPTAPPPPATASANETAPTRPPAPPVAVPEPSIVPPEPVRDEAISSASPDELNRNSPLRPVFFDLDSSDLSTEGQHILDANAAILKQNATWTVTRSEEHTSELQSRFDLVCRLLLEKKKNS